MIFSGQIEVSDETRTWTYIIPRCIVRDTTVSFDFHGRYDGCNFTGHCIAEKLISKFIGSGEFQYEGYEPYASKVELDINISNNTLEINGSWSEKEGKYNIHGELDRHESL